ncbi:MAG: transcription-repair coupling factor [Clostridiales bacterium]|nr:transcription-repair coupling factor [Clostridiales bacterium]
MQFLYNAITGLREYPGLLAAVGRGRLPAALSGLSHIHKALLVAALTADSGQPGLVITADEGEAVRLKEDLEVLGKRAVLYPARDFTFRNLTGQSREYEHVRLGTLSRLMEEDFDVVLCGVDAAVQLTIPPAQLYGRTFTLKQGQSLSPDGAVGRLLAAGYVRAEQVEGPGQFALRGGILDFFTPDLPQPIRVEFWGDEIDSLAAFEVESQRRLDSLKQVRVAPAAEVLFDSEEDLAGKIEAFLRKKRRKPLPDQAVSHLQADIDSLRNGVGVAADRYLPLAYDGPATLFDYTENALLFVSESAKIRDRMKNMLWQQGEDVSALMAEGWLCEGLDTYTLDNGGLLQRFEESGALFMENFARGSYDVPIREAVNFSLKQSSLWSGSLEVLLEDVNGGRGTTVILAGGERAAKNLAEELTRHDRPAQYIPANREEKLPAGLFVTTGGLSAGFELPESGFTLISQGKAAGKGKRLKKRRKDAKEIGSLEELRPGDYVVHTAHGIGIYEGIQQITVEKVTKDYIKIRYAGKDTLYVPVTQLDLVSKYIGPGEDAGVKLHKLGGEQWQKTRARVKKAVKDMAKQLTVLYAKRMSAPGYAFSPDTDMQNDFERRFEYDETEDQLRCIQEIKSDMERSIPMDRLLCGDVGFGKTEVALRAAFKCMTEGKQCALLVPTTILAWQHYQTAMRRMDGMPVKVELLSRFRTPAQQAEIIKEVRRGNIDMVIGTHRLISKDVGWKDLGLVIVDEEQRFGVAQKERLKELYPNVDVLTLSATPIPRTLNMAMSGLRDMSAIEEAPEDRHPVQTYVLEQDNGILLDAIRKELRRGGQVYYLHNRVESIEAAAARLQQKLPDHQVGVAHGKMSEEELSRVWERLLEHEIDVLVCTTIIETGVDVSNANTLIIEDADRMGLSQLHQLRGRVGRSARRAYAYLCFRRGKALSDIATKRMEAIREYTEFGSGFKIAMRDLEIRGAGNILGGEQHGHMEAVGYDMYLKLLADAVNEEKGLEPAPDAECTVDLRVQAHIPEKYIESLPQRLGVYRRIAAIRTEEDMSDVLDELIDRFGEPPAAVKGLIDVAMLRNQAAALHVTEVVQKEENMLLYLSRLDTEQAGKLAGALKGRVLLSAGQKPYLSVKILKGQGPLDTLREALAAMAA